MAGDDQLTYAATPNLALRRLDPLVGTWTLTGRTLGATADDIRGQVTIEWALNRHFLVQRGEMEIQGFSMQSLEIVGYDAATDTFTSQVYSTMGETAQTYHWDVQGNEVTHWTEGSKYTGTFSEGERILAGGWRPVGSEATAGNAYDATMTRVETK